MFKMSRIIYSSHHVKFYKKKDELNLVPESSDHWYEFPEGFMNDEDRYPVPDDAKHFSVVIEENDEVNIPSPHHVIFYDVKKKVLKVHHFGKGTKSTQRYCIPLGSTEFVIRIFDSNECKTCIYLQDIYTDEMIFDIGDDYFYHLKIIKTLIHDMQTYVENNLKNRLTISVKFNECL